MLQARPRCRILTLLSLSLAADSPHLYFKQAIAGGGWPGGVLSNTVLEVRTPLHRSKSVVFQSTYAGIGADVALSPAFAIGQVRVSLAPIDVFDVNLRAGRGYYFDNGLGLLPFDRLSGTLDAQRSARADEGFGAWTWNLGADPTLKAKIWKIILVDTWVIDWLVTERPTSVTAPYIYEPLRDLVIRDDDVAFEQQVVLLYEAMDGKDGPLVMFGPTVRDRGTTNSKDRSTTVGALILTKPWKKPILPSFAGMVLWYVVDNDRVGPIPSFGVQAKWELEAPFEKK